MTPVAPTENSTVTASAQTQLAAFHDQVSPQVAAIHAAALETLRAPEAASRDGLTVTITTGPEAADEPTTLRQSVTCWTHTYPCGTGTSGYIMCSERVCMIV
jgi:hypothetical protein